MCAGVVVGAMRVMRMMRTQSCCRTRKMMEAAIRCAWIMQQLVLVVS